MAKIILVLGDEGTGKSTSLRNFPAESSYLIAPNGKPLPWRGSKKQFVEGNNLFRTNDLVNLKGTIETVNGFKTVKHLIVDDYSHYFTARTLSPEFMAQNTGNAAFGRYAKLAAEIYQSVWQNASLLRSDLTIYILTHTELRNDGKIVMKTPGNLVDKDVKPASHVTYVLHTMVTDAKEPELKYMFLTNSDGIHAAKTPIECFDQLLIPNDLFAASKVIEAYESGE